MRAAAQCLTYDPVPMYTNVYHVDHVPMYTILAQTALLSSGVSFACWSGVFRQGPHLTLKSSKWVKELD